MAKKQEVVDELHAVEKQLDKARGEIEGKLVVRAPFDATFALVPTFKFVTA